MRIEANLTCSRLRRHGHIADGNCFPYPSCQSKKDHHRRPSWRRQRRGSSSCARAATPRKKRQGHESSCPAAPQAPMARSRGLQQPSAAAPQQHPLEWRRPSSSRVGPAHKGSGAARRRCRPPTQPLPTYPAPAPSRCAAKPRLRAAPFPPTAARLRRHTAFARRILHSREAGRDPRRPRLPNADAVISRLRKPTPL